MRSKGILPTSQAMRLTPNEPHGPMFDNTNRGKKSVVLDLKQSSEQEHCLPSSRPPVHGCMPHTRILALLMQDLLHKLIETADVFVTNVTNPALIRLGV